MSRWSSRWFRGFSFLAVPPFRPQAEPKRSVLAALSICRAAERPVIVAGGRQLRASRRGRSEAGRARRSAADFRSRPRSNGGQGFDHGNHPLSVRRRSGSIRRRGGPTAWSTARTRLFRRHRDRRPDHPFLGSGRRSARPADPDRHRRGKALGRKKLSPLGRRQRRPPRWNADKKMLEGAADPQAAGKRKGVDRRGAEHLAANGARNTNRPLTFRRGLPIRTERLVPRASLAMPRRDPPSWWSTPGGGHARHVDGAGMYSFPHRSPESRAYMRSAGHLGLGVSRRARGEMPAAGGSVRW